MKKIITKTIVAILISVNLNTAVLSQGATPIRFARGRTSATVSGNVAGNNFRQYALSARYGQYLSANISSPNNCVIFSQGSTFIGFTTDSGYNYIELNNTCGRRASFTMTVSIR